MTFWQKIKLSIAKFMQGRHGADNLGMFTLLSGLIISLLGSFTRIGLLSIIGLALYIITLFLTDNSSCDKLHLRVRS